MTPAETAAFLRQFNEWRRGDEDIPQPDPRVIGEAIDAAVEMIDRLEAAEKELAELRSSMKFRTSLIGRTEAERDALRAKIKQMEKQAPIGTLPGAKGWDPAMQDALMKFDPATGEERPYPSHATQWRNWHGTAAWLFDPWTGKRRNAYDVGSDVHGLLIAPAGTLGMDMGGSCAEKNNVAGAQPAPSVPDEIERDVLRACCGTFHGSRHRITCEKYKGKREPGDKP